MATIDTSTPYTLTNSFTGPSKLLAISDSSLPFMLTDPPNTRKEAQWILQKQDIPPFYSLHTVASGTDYALDVINDQGTASIKLHLAPTTRASGQYWLFDEVSGVEGYQYRLSNNFTGPNMHLDVYSDTLEPHLAGGDASGQYWKLSRVETEGGGGGSALPSGSAVVSGAEGTATVTATPSPVAIDGGGGLSAGGIAGVVVGGVVAVALLVGVVAWIVINTRRGKGNVVGETDDNHDVHGDKKGVVGGNVP